MYGAIAGAALFVARGKNVLQALMARAFPPPRRKPACRILPACSTRTAGCSGSAWMFILAVYFVPTGIVGGCAGRGTR